MSENFTPPTQAELDALKKCPYFHSSVSTGIIRRLIAEVERLRGNPPIGTCVFCGLLIWPNQERMMDGRGMFHPGCVTRGEITRLTKEVEELRKDKERLEAIGLLWSATFQKYESWKANGVMNDTLKQVLIDYHNCDSAMQQKGEE